MGSYVPSHDHLNKKDESIKQKYLIPSVTGKDGCLCITEPFGGSDVTGQELHPQNGDHYVSMDQKPKLPTAFTQIISSRSQKIPHPNTRNLSIYPRQRNARNHWAKLDKLGWKASDTGRNCICRVKVPSKFNGRRGKGFPYIMQHFALERLIMGINAHETEYTELHR